MSAKKIQIKNKQRGVPQENVLDLRKIYRERIAKQEPPQKEVVKAKRKKKKKAIQKLFSSWALARKQKKAAQIEKKAALKKEKQAKKAAHAKDQKLKKELQQKEKQARRLVKTKIKKVKQEKQQAVKKTIKKVKKVEKKVEATVRVSRWQIFKPLAVFTILCLIIILPFSSSAFYQQIIEVKDRVLNSTSSALFDLKQGGLATAAADYEQANTDFQSAIGEFQKAQAELQSINQTISALAKAVPGKGQELKSAEQLLIAGENITGAAADINKTLAILSSFNLEEISNSEDDDIGLTTVIMVAHSALRPAVYKIEKANIALSEVSLDVIPEADRDKVAMAQELLPKVEKDLKRVISLSETFLAILGHQEKKRYLILFQNNHEIRATGGFIGSMAMLDLDKGKIEKMDIPGGGSYDISGQLDEKIISPEPLHLINAHWYLQDANWWPDFPTSAQKIAWFYEHSGGTTVDGIITLTPEVIEELLRVTGPLDMSADYDEIITADNFYDIVQLEAEQKYDETQESKQIIADLTPELLNKLMDLRGENLFDVITVLQRALNEKDLLLYFNDPNLQADIINLGWAGEIKQTDRDYLSVVNTNIGGGKSDAAIEEIIEHRAEIMVDGTIRDQVTITRTHKASEADQFAHVSNWDYMRVYVPGGSHLLSAEGFTSPDPNLILEPDADYEVDHDLTHISGNVIEKKQYSLYQNQEFNKTVFAGWVQTPVGGSSQITLEYQLPFSINMDHWLDKTDTYSLLAQKQAGSFDSLLLTELVVAGNYEMIWQSEPECIGKLSKVLNTDYFKGIVLKKK